MDGHHCRDSTNEVTVFYKMSLANYEPSFRGFLEIVTHITKPPNHQRTKIGKQYTEESRSYCIVIDMVHINTDKTSTKKAKTVGYIVADPVGTPGTLKSPNSFI